MKGIVLWISGAALAFFFTAGAFLLLANLASAPSDKSLTPDSSSGGSRPALDLSLDEGQLASLSPLPNQSLDLTVNNEGSRQLSDVNVTLGVSSENTSLPDSLYYRQTVEKLPPGEAATVHFEFDLSTLGQPVARPTAAVPEPSRKILEIRATTPEGISAVRTAILPP
ncbi:MAG TPA: hypothetical protein VFI90_01420 [Rubrobacter sp.]|nr:hypothetical protein [Rubrobacter sp.]